MLLRPNLVYSLTFSELKLQESNKQQHPIGLFVTMTKTPIADKVECVGSLLLHTKDIQELSEAPAPHLPEVNIKKRVTELLVAKGDGTVSKESQVASPSLRRRITDRLNGPATPTEEIEELDF